MDVQKSPVTGREKKLSRLFGSKDVLKKSADRALSLSMAVRAKDARLSLNISWMNHVATVTACSYDKVSSRAGPGRQPPIMFEHLKRIRGWVETDGSYERGFGPKQDPKVQEARYVLSTCMTCGCCLEAVLK